MSNVPRLRFRNEDGTEFPGWTQKELGQLGNFMKGAPLSKSDISINGSPLILYGELYTTYGEVAYQVVRKSEAVVDEKYISRSGDVVIPTSGETPEEISTATCVMLDGVILAGDLYIYRTTNEIDGQIMSYLLNHQINNCIASIAQGKSIVHIKSEDLCKLKVNYPSALTEQRRIADFFSTLDDVIRSIKQKIAAYED